MSSITEPRRESGQALVVFTVWLFLLLMMASIAFDVGQSLFDRRKQQNAADAAALAGARYLTATTPAWNGTCAAAPGGQNVIDAACDIAEANGFFDGQDNIVVRVRTPPGPDSFFSGQAGYVQVNVNSTRTSFWQGRLLPPIWRVSSMGVATNGAEGAAPFSFIALNQTACPSVLVSGQGRIVSGSTIQINSSCPNGALQTTGQAFIDVLSPNGQINVVGDWQNGNNTNVDPPPIEGAAWQPDPLSELPEPPVPAMPAPVVSVVGTMTVPSGCPGGATAATPTAPALCQFTSSYAGTEWRLFPGYYPGGLKFQAGKFYLEPGIYYIGGGGIDANGTGAAIYSVASGATAPPVGGGVLIFNGETEAYHNECAGTGTFPAGVSATTACIGPIKLNGSSAPIQLHAIESGPFAGIVIYQDRDLSVADPSGGATRASDISINGSSSSLSVVGTIYAPRALIELNGNTGTSSTIQVIADSFKLTGNNANMTATYDGNAFFKIKGIGLVQ